MGTAPLWKCARAGMGGDLFWAAVWETSDAGQLQGYHTVWSPLCPCAALGLQQALLLHAALVRTWKEAFGM